MSKQTTTKTTKVKGVSFVRRAGDIHEYRLASNGLTILYKHVPNTGIVTTNIVYRVGAKDEQPGETGLAHMLEHMLFKPTKQDLKKRIDSSAMQFERETGCILNANTWKDRTTYYFTYPREHMQRALTIEAERMHDVVLSDKEFLPERNNVLSEFDMYFGNPEFAIAVSMVAAAFQSHPYGHETIGFREDIEDYTAAKLEAFYRNYYRPDNATLMVIGDISTKEALTCIAGVFGQATNPTEPIQRMCAREPMQEGERRVTITRPSNTNMLALGVRHNGFPTPAWYTSYIALSVLAEGPESILEQLLVDTGIASSLRVTIEPTAEPNLAILYITLAASNSHDSTETLVRNCIKHLSVSDISRLVKKRIAALRTEAAFTRTSSLKTAMELTEYVAADAWHAYHNEEATLAAITPKQVHQAIQTMFDSSQMVIGSFVGKKN